MFNCDIYYRVIVGFIMKILFHEMQYWELPHSVFLRDSVVTNTGFNICVVL